MGLHIISSWSILKHKWNRVTIWILLFCRSADMILRDNAEHVGE